MGKLPLSCYPIWPVLTCGSSRLTNYYCAQDTPAAGAYFNEADTFEVDWQEQFWGTDNYNKLLGMDTHHPNVYSQLPFLHEKSVS